MNSIVTKDFLACFARLPDEIKTHARRAYRTWQADPSSRGLHFKPVRGHIDLYSVRIGRGWRALGTLRGDTVTWFWIGSHSEYDGLIA